MAVVGGVYIIPYFPHQENKNQGEARWIILLEDFVKTVLIVPLTKQTQQISNYPKSFIIKKDSPEGKQMGLPHNSIIMIERVTEMSKFVISKATQCGVCSEELLEKIKASIP